jgi:hypothetical protein
MSTLRVSEQLVRDVERICKRAGKPLKIENILERAMVQLFLKHVDITLVEALNRLKKEFAITLSQAMLSKVLTDNNNLSHKRLSSC